MISSLLTCGASGRRSHSWQAGYGKVMTGRIHYGDENGKTWYRFATVSFEG
ncbi:hypothetical protein [Nonomuraea africana]|uniref:Uncharacterized protein n=1 Tax=Nonomuraea africana TaxID=46171 RepID=A0ABR9KAW0_9ACTN|nr:hypothetical protein [Nonomuraea africana]MBE1558975.1 hypothetical protein [Nonomuraea africana]